MITNEFNTIEKLALSELTAITGNSIWHTAIDNVIQSKNPEKFRQLISELKSQASDCPEVMMSIIGPRAFTLVAIAE